MAAPAKTVAKKQSFEERLLMLEKQEKNRTMEIQDLRKEINRLRTEKISSDKKLFKVNAEKNAIVEKVFELENEMQKLDGVAEDIDHFKKLRQFFNHMVVNAHAKKDDVAKMKSDIEGIHSWIQKKCTEDKSSAKKNEKAQTKLHSKINVVSNKLDGHTHSVEVKIDVIKSWIAVKSSSDETRKEENETTMDSLSSEISLIRSWMAGKSSRDAAQTKKHESSVKALSSEINSIKSIMKTKSSRDKARNKENKTYLDSLSSEIHYIDNRTRNVPSNDILLQQFVTMVTDDGERTRQRFARQDDRLQDLSRKASISAQDANDKKRQVSKLEERMSTTRKLFWIMFIGFCIYLFIQIFKK